MSDNRSLIRDFILHELLNGEQADELEFDTNLLVSGLVDSLGMVRLIAHLEEKLSVKIPPEDVTIENFISIDVMADYLKTVQTS
ncbi:MAG: acyl carrier protein [Verrucomicrobiaceae bacterium]|nr:acyl carrier protein [Verrucomicrobiaceae bacterium]NCF89570.1 acyl carrier protein [Verrucomicrobiaceae bacterium]